MSGEIAFPSTVERTTHDTAAPARRMRLRYGFNEINGWWHFSRGEHHAKVRRHLRLMDTSIIRIFAFDQPVPDPFKNWHGFSIYVQGVLDAGADPRRMLAEGTNVSLRIDPERAYLLPRH